jgi:hypothetical protein
VQARKMVEQMRRKATTRWLRIIVAIGELGEPLT